MWAGDLDINSLWRKEDDRTDSRTDNEKRYHRDGNQNPIPPQVGSAPQLDAIRLATYLDCVARAWDCRIVRSSRSFCHV